MGGVCARELIISPQKQLIMDNLRAYCYYLRLLQ